MAVTAGLIAAGVGASASIGSLFIGGGGPRGLSRSDKRRLAYGQLQQDRAVAKAELNQNLARDQVQSAEESRLELFGRLGEVGTYEQNFDDYREQNPQKLAASGIFDTKRYTKQLDSSQYRYLVPRGGRTSKYDVETDFNVNVEGDVADPEKFGDYVMDTRQGRAASYFATTIDQLQRKEGEVYDLMVESTVGTIYQNSSALMKEQMDTITRNLAKTSKGARRQGLEALMKVQAVENANSIRQDALWKSALAIEEYSTNLFMEGTNFLMDWTDGIVRDKFNEMNIQLGRFYGETILPSAISVARSDQELAIRQYTLDEQARAADTGMKEIVGGIGDILLGAGIQSVSSGLNKGGGGTTTGNQANQNLRNSLLGGGGASTFDPYAPNRTSDPNVMKT